jgi:D-psicose/D-tagatose/L-ribulose 3-epimerase
MKLGLVENAWWGTKVDRVTGIKIARAYGFDNYSILMQDMTPRLRRRMRKTLEDEGLPVSSFLSVATSLEDWNTDIRRYTVEWLKGQIDVGYDFNARTMILVPGEYIWAKQEIKPEVQWRWTVESLREVGDHAKSLDIEIGLECETPKHNMLRTIDDLVRMIKDVRHPAIKANVDLVHMYVVGDEPKDLEKLKGKLLNVHLSDCHARRHEHSPPGRGAVPLMDDLKTLKKLGFDGTLDLELEWCPEPDRVREWVKEGYVETARMMEGLKIRTGEDG